jgi:conjugal transfer pilus assembly protein TraU
MVDVTREPGVMVNMGGFKIDLGRTGTGTAGQSDRPAAGTFYHVHWYKYPLIFWLNIITSLGVCRPATWISPISLKLILSGMTARSRC